MHAVSGPWLRTHPANQPLHLPESLVLVGTVEIARLGPRLQAMVLMLVLLAVASLGLGLPWLGFRDCDCGLTTEQERRLKIQTASRFDAPELRLQLTRGASASSDPDAATGIVTLRGPFGIKTGQAEFRTNGEGDFHWSVGRELGAWALLLLGLALPAVGLARLAVW